ncbi:MAG: polysaccharide biosynthesis C-terminal domain-containing protein [Acidobacteriaceae bacterium]|nr:polysaccharide biosynthesis C-terminal domain-containing protein [Acidobacteriaceae bacterium]
MTVSALQESSDAADQCGQKSRKIRKFVNWGIKGSLALFDQGLFSGCNFVLSILLARWLPADQYGAYAVAFSAYLLLLMLYQSLLLEPMAVFGSGEYRDCLRAYMKSVVRLHFATSASMLVLLAAFAAAATKIAPAGGLPGAFLALSIAGPLLLMLGLARRAFYLEFLPAPAAFGSLLYCVLTLGALFPAYKYHLLSPFSGLLLMGLGALVPCVILFARLKPRLSAGARNPSLAEVWQRHWKYGRWALGGYAMMWIPANIFYPLVGSFRGIAQAGELKALANLASPVLQTYAAISALLLPYAARTLREKRYVGAGGLAARITLCSVSGAAIYWGVLLVFKGPIFHLLYGGKYMSVAYLLPVVAFGSVACSAFFGSGTVLRALESPSLVFAAVCISSCISLLIGVPATWIFGLQGAAWSMAVSELLNFVMVIVLMRRMLRRAPSSKRETTGATLSGLPIPSPDL